MCNGPSCNSEYIRNRISNEKISTQNTSNGKNIFFTKLKRFCLNDRKNLILGHLSINSLRNKFETIIEDRFEIFLTLETKNSFPNSQFLINGYRMFRRDWNCFGRGLCLYLFFL